MTDPELCLYQMLRELIPHKDIMTQAPMDALIIPAAPTFAQRQSIRRRCSHERIDFLIIDPVSGKPEIIIELEDRSRNAQKDAQRDEITAAAGYRTLRIDHPKPTPEHVSQLIKSTFQLGDQSK